MNVKYVIRRATALLTILTLCLFLVPASFAKKGGGGKPPSEPPPSTCTGQEPQDPEIAFLTALDTSGDIHTQDLYLSSISGCDQYLLLTNAVQKLPDGSPSEGPGEYLVNITDLRLDIEGDLVVVTWRDRSQSPVPQIGLIFNIDEIDDFDGVPQQLYVSSDGANARGGDVRINDQDEIELIMVESAADGSEWWISYLNTNAPTSYSVLSSGACLLVDCYQPSYARAWWNDDGSQVYVDFTKQGDADGMALARIARDNNDQWLPAEILMTHYAHIAVIGILSNGMIAYERMEIETNKRGKIMSRPWVTAVIDPDPCVPCLPSEGNELAADGTKYPRGWTRNGGLLFIETGPGNQRNIREYSDPFTGEIGNLDLRDVDRFERDTTF